MKPVPLFGLGVSGKSVNVSAQRRLNLYCQIEKDPEKNVVTMYPTPGLVSSTNFGSSPVRGMWTKGDYIYAVHGDKLYSVDNAGAYVHLGTLNSNSGRVDMCDNGTQIIMVDGADGYIWDTSSDTFDQIVDADWPGADTVTFINGYFVVSQPDTAKFYISALYDGLSWDALEFSSAESDPDNLVRVFSDNGQLILFGSKTTEFWGDSSAVDFPFTRVGSSAIEWGLAARWSLTKFDNSLMFLRKNRLGQTQVCKMQGYTAVPVSDVELDYEISQYGQVGNATAFSYMNSGHPFYQITFPSVGKTWLYDGQSDSWSELQSSDGRHRAELQTQYLDQSYVSDYENGKIYTFDQNAYTDDGAPIVREFISRHQNPGVLMRVGQIWLEMEGGVGLVSGQGDDPMVMMQISRDGGHTWGAEVWRSIGAIGNYGTRAVFNRVGLARDWLYKFRVSDPVKTVFVGAWGRYGA